jgi:hypothetical protein
MALSQKHRSSLYLTLSPLVGTEEAEALLQEFPANDRDVPATKDFVRSEVGVLRSELHQELGLVRQEMHHALGLVRQEMHHELGLVRQEMHHELGLVRQEIGVLRVAINRQTVWLSGMVLTAMSFSTAINTWVVLSSR